MVNVARSILLFALLTGVNVHAASSDETQSFALPGHGALQLRIPGSWAGRVKQPTGNLPPTIALTPRSGSPFQVLITTVWPADAGAALPGIAEVKREVESAAKEAAPESVEGTLVVTDLSSGANHGYYFNATDRAPKVGEFKYLTQGIICIGKINLAFTILTNDGQDSVVRSALDALRGALQV